MVCIGIYGLNRGLWFDQARGRAGICGLHLRVWGLIVKSLGIYVLHTGVEIHGLNTGFGIYDLTRRPALPGGVSEGEVEGSGIYGLNLKVW